MFLFSKTTEEPSRCLPLPHLGINKFDDIEKFLNDVPLSTTIHQKPKHSLDSLLKRRVPLKLKVHESYLNEGHTRRSSFPELLNTTIPKLENKTRIKRQRSPSAHSLMSNKTRNKFFYNFFKRNP